jgi:probable F420-dependent oxidoreductase
MTVALGTRGISTVGLDMVATARLAARAEDRGVDAVWTSETYARSGMVSLAAMATSTRRAAVGSAILHGVGRAPVVLAADLLAVDELSGGRLVVGLGNGTKRMLAQWFDADPDAPAVRMEELVLLLRRLWRLHAGPVRHAGRFYRIDISPTGDLAPPLRDHIPIFTAGVNPRMIEVAGRVADGLIGHPLFGLRYLEDVVRPSIAAGAERTGRNADDIAVAGMVLCAVHEDVEQARREAAAQIALYASAKTYERPLAVAGFARESAEIRDAFARQDFGAMVAATSDAMVDALSVTGTVEQVQAGLRRYDGLLDHVIAYAPTVDLTAERIATSIAALTDVTSASPPRSDDSGDHR